MSSKKRVFSTQNDINYKDYISQKIGSETLKSVKNNNQNLTINRFVNYEQFLALTKGYYKHLHLDKCDLYPTTNLYNSNISFVTINDDEKFVKNECELNKQFLYPYGFFESKKIVNQHFPSKICLENWCSKNTVCRDYINFDVNNDNNTNNNYNKCKKKCKTGLCKNAKPLFI